jgi:hypothetical protein
MMEPTRNVILDLLPLYLANEASEDTQTLVKEHLDQDPDLAQLARQWNDNLPEPPPAPVNPDAQAVAYTEAKRQIANRVITLATVLAAGILTVAGTALMGAMFLLAR